MSETRQAKALLTAYDAVRARLSGDELLQAIRSKQIERLIEEAAAEAVAETVKPASTRTRGAMRVEDVRSRMLAAGMEIVRDGKFSIVAEGNGGTVLVHAMEHPKGWRLANALEARAATTAAIVRRPEDIERFCARLLQVGAL